ncbi:MAG TPA: iron-sulfur cluster assembly scaffold protein [Sphingomicrobium sp.]|nr:iron-sulfur cluster assembly scaffold protein [Sphingomicrobium sp.]
MNAPLYTTEILRLAASLPEMRELEKEDGRAELKSPTCGSRIITAVELDDEQKIRMVSQEVKACAFGQASAALLQHNAIGRAHDEVASAIVEISRWLAREQEDPGDWPGILALEPARSRKSRHGAILLPFRALLAAIEASR